jgi:aminoglycoside phosphotransferase
VSESAANPEQANDLEGHRARASAVLAELGLNEVHLPDLRPVSGHSSSILVPCSGTSGEPFLLKYFIPPAEGIFYPPDVRIDDYARREGAFYRFLDTVDPGRKQLPAPRTIVIDARDPPQWILLERIPVAKGPAEEVLGQDHVFELLSELQSIGVDTLLGRRNFPLNRWDTVSYLDRVRLMYDPVLFVIGERRWTRIQEFYKEALRWTETRPPVLVHGDFTEQNVLVDQNGHPYLLDFERVGIGSFDHDFAWFWIHSTRSAKWKRQLLARYFSTRIGGDRIRSEWGIRAALVYLALRRLRFNYLMYGEEDPQVTPNLALLDAALEGGSAVFPEDR